LSEQAVVQDGTVITSRGPGTAMDFALYLIETLTDRATRDQVEAGLVRS
jgi:4-methyl-5(b-hydroxyethyl)-thiazole monophosphate biosynthesis